jgi:hypothetical protein
MHGMMQPKAGPMYAGVWPAESSSRAIGNGTLCLLSRSSGHFAAAEGRRASDSCWAEVEGKSVRKVRWRGEERSDRPPQRS